MHESQLNLHSNDDCYRALRFFFFVALEVKVKVRAYQFANKLNFPLLLKRSLPAVTAK